MMKELPISNAADADADADTETVNSGLRARFNIWRRNNCWEPRPPLLRILCAGLIMYELVTGQRPKFDADPNAPLPLGPSLLNLVGNGKP